MNYIYEEINPQAVDKADIAVFIPSLNEAATIGLPVSKISSGVRTHYPQHSAVIVNCDNHSQDGTKEAFFAADCDVPKIYISTPPTVTGKGANLINAFQKAAQLQAKAVVIIDANLSSIKTGWIKSLVEPIITAQAEFVTPLYLRHPFDAPVSRTLAYPIMRAMFGRRVLQPIGVDRAFSPRINEVFLSYGGFELEDKGYSLDLTMLALAAINQATICQSFMAHPRVSAPRLNPISPAPDMNQQFTQVTTAIFELMLKTDKHWLSVTRSKPTILAGLDLPPQNLPPQVALNSENLWHEFIHMGQTAKPFWQKMFDNGLYTRLLAHLEASPHTLSLTAEDWCQAIYSALVFYKNNPPERPMAVSALTPLLSAKSLTLYNMAQNINEQQYNSLQEADAFVFDAEKKPFMARWKGDS
ncbi:MAG: hypothetical protein ACRCTY_04225 [Candidatus Adiutrix sp.]